MDCLACGQTSSPATKEHVFSQWLPRELGSPSMSFYRRYGDGSSAPYRQMINLESFTLKRICQDCNNGWMSRLENLVKPTMVALMRRERHLDSLAEVEKRALAKWAAKTAIVDSYSVGAECPIDSSVLKWMQRNQSDVPGPLRCCRF